MATIYAVVRIDVTGETSYFDFHVYSKQTSNLEVIKAYAKEIKHKYPYCRIFVMSREKANQLHHKFIQKFEEEEKRKILVRYQEELRRYC